MNRIGKGLRPCAAYCLMRASAGGWVAGEVHPAELRTVRVTLRRRF